MKKLGMILLLFAYLSTNAQNLQDVYKQSTVHLNTVPGYADNDWSKVFVELSTQSQDANFIKQLVVAPDGSVFMSNKSRYAISKFDKNGKYVKDFGKKGGKLASDFIYSPTVQGVLDGKYIYTSAVDGRLHFFDLNGNWIKTLRLNYMPLNTIPLKNNKIAILGHVPMGNASKQTLSIFDVNTNKQKVLTSNTELYASANQSRIVIEPIEYTDKEGKKQKGPMISYSLPFSNPLILRERIGTDSKGNLIVGYPITGKIVIYNIEGVKIKEFQVDMPHPKISKEEMEEFYQKMSKQLDEMSNKVNITDERYKNQYVAQYRSQLEKYKNPANYPSNLPYFAEMMIDSDDNILLLNFTKEAGSNKFDVFTYNSNGHKIGTSSFVSSEYNLKISPSVFTFYKGQIVAFQQLKNAKVNNMRLVKFNLTK